MDRREFFKHTAAAGAGTFLLGGAPPSARPLRQSPNEKVRFACIGVGGKGDSDTNDAGKHGEIVALCDIDSEVLDKMGKEYPKAKKYFDYRKMLEELGDKIDAVTVSTPDHTHAPASVMAMRMGKHCFCQKPLTWSVEEARLMRTLAAEKKLCTQMGNQGTAEDGFREGVELIRSGVLGPIKEIYVWTNRPIWPQGISRPKDTPGIPNKVRWTEFLGAAPDRPYHPDYQPFNWRGWLDFGTGALGDMACHTINIAAMALELFDPESVEVVDTSGIVDHETYPVWSIIRTRFGQRNGRGPLILDLVRRRRQPARRKADLQGTPPRRKGPRAAGCSWSARRARSYSVNDYGAEHTLLPKDKFKEVAKPKPTLPRSPGHFKELVEAIKAGDPNQGAVQFRLRRPAHRDRAPGRGRAQGRHRHRVGPGGDEGQERSLGRSVHQARLSQGILDPR